MVRNIKETFPPKTEMWEKIQGMSKIPKMHAACCMLSSKLHWVYLFPVEDVENVYNVYELQCRF